MNLSAHFTLDELTHSDIATRNGWNNSPAPLQQAYLHLLACDVLEPLRAALGAPLIINSGYRCQQVNSAVGGQSDSAHMDGRAADIRSAAFSTLEICRMAYALALPVAQIINEFGGWVHIAIPVHDVAPLRQCLRSARTASGVVYRRGFE